MDGKNFAVSPTLNIKEAETLLVGRVLNTETSKRTSGFSSMAQKRMFDRAITDSEKFLDMPMSSKGLYFLLGMAADDEGFVSAKSVLRVHGGTDDDLNILLAKGFCLKFASGIVVIMDWKKNNWLDSRRIRKTEYTEERKQLLTQDNRYVLSNGLARIEENRVDKNRIVSDEGNANTGRELSQEEISERLQRGRDLLRNKKTI